MRTMVRPLVALFAAAASVSAMAGETAPTDCPVDAVYGQPLDLSGKLGYGISDQDAGLQQFEQIISDRPVTALRWWAAFDLEYDNACLAETFYEVELYAQDELGEVGEYLDGATLQPTVDWTGLFLGSSFIYAYEVTLPSAVTLPGGIGFVSLWSGGNGPACTWKWVGSESGDGTSLSYNTATGVFETQATDLSICVQALAPGECGPGFGNLRVQVFGEGPFPVGNATVLLDGVTAGVFDSEDGLYYFDCVSFAPHSLSVELEGYKDETHLFEFGFDGQFETLNLEIANEGDPCGNGEKGCATTTTVFVSVYDDATSDPITNASVSIPSIFLTISDNTAGVYVVPDLGDGNYEAQVEAPGYEPRSEAFFVDDTGTFNLVVRMESVPATVPHSADSDANGVFSLGELLSVIQLYNSARYHCEPSGYAPGPGSTLCGPHSSDYSGNFRISLSELLRTVQLFTFGTYVPCPNAGTEDGFCTGAEKVR